MLEIKPVLPGEDDIFLFEVYASSRTEEMAAWGWDEKQRREFLRQQHAVQQLSYRQRYPGLQYRIILSDGAKAGRMAMAQSDQELVLVDIILLPEFQNKGLGTAVLTALQAQAAANRLPLRLNVLSASRARQLYERLGFQADAAGELYTAMKWTPPANCQ
ncbi:MAG TPA: GNAT family N-acetyltransferase [Methylomusa anaerophila]|uniref:Acetyltransferase (GNAT) family protein n=1 Tax=Methylomusa anaerophila TaxID=1930071 RepID=A0A348AH27_9FIRM|nr:GNAT family N-acetyltransferase [Methylomusa anaerophila]BBB90375.1 acetyltransferase (GNAT) family protein [Methylomusa anaerophila]HML89278.1 GNAT family N-acetyltransferase [Methylomusa anaerophila]